MSEGTGLWDEQQSGSLENECHAQHTDPYTQTKRDGECQEITGDIREQENTRNLEASELDVQWM